MKGLPCVANHCRQPQWIARTAIRVVFPLPRITCDKAIFNSNSWCALLAVAQTYFDAAYEMDADKFASIFHHSSSVTKVGDDGNVSVTPIETWLAAVRTIKAPKQLGLERRDEILSIEVVREFALLKLKFQIPPPYLTDMLLCLRVDGTWKMVQKAFTTETR